MKLLNQDKDAIRIKAQQYVERYPSQNKAANSLVGISAGTLSTILNGRYETISDDMFMRLAAQIGARKKDDWVLCATTAYEELNTLFDDAQRYQSVAWAVAPAGSGKTTTAADYASRHDNVFVISCSEDMHRGDFIREMARAIGIDVSSSTLRSALEMITKHMTTLENPLLIFDEADKLTDNIFYYFITIYNRLDEYCGIIFLSTHYIERRMKNGLAYNKKGYDEIFSRINRRFIKLTGVSAYQAEAIARANGLSNEKDIREVVKDAAESNFDLRRVRRAVHKTLRLASEK